MAGNDRWNLNRVGRAAAATTVSGRPPAYGLAVDLGVGTAPVMSTDEYNRMMRDLATRTATQQLRETPEYQAELQSAQRYQSMGLFASDDAVMNDGSASGFSRLAPGMSGTPAENLMTGINLFKSGAAGVYNDVVGGGLRSSVIDVLGLGDQSDLPDNSYEHYRDLKGILSEDDFNSLDEKTRAYLVRRAQSQQSTGAFLAAPGISEAVTGFMAAYRGAQTPFIMAAQHGLVGGPNANPITGVDPMWFKGSEWAEAWKKSQDQSLGNAIVDSVLQPYVGEEKVDRWKRDSAVYQLTSLGVEVGAGWYLDPGVIAGRGLGTSLRFARGEMPLSEGGRAYTATQQALQREQITVGGLAARVGRLNAKHINNRWDRVAEYARTHSLADFAHLRMFARRDIDGQAAAAALHWAFNEAPESGIKLADFAKRAPGEGVDLYYPDLPELTKQLLHGDPKAYDDFERLKRAAPEELDKFAPGAQTFIDAIEATKTKIPQLQKEMEELEAHAEGGQLSLFHDWSIHTDIDQKARDIAEADEALNKYQGYGEWLNAMSNNPRVSQVSAPGRIREYTRRFYMDNQFGQMHAINRFTRPMWIQKANTAEMHDVDSGAMSIRRQFEQFDHLFGYTDLDALNDYLHRWITAGTSGERYEVMRELEETHLIQAAAQKFEVDPEVIRVIYHKVIEEQNKTLAGYRKGQESIFSTAPDLQTRLDDPNSNIGLVARDADSGMVTLEFMDSGRRHTVTVHESALEQKHTGPIDTTQTYNYYQPVDTRRFYLALKHSGDVVREMGLAGITKANAAHYMNAIGTTFNQLWKPAVLFRFGWPMRVLMDENMRALSVLGIPAFTHHYGSAYARAANNAVVRTGQAVHNRYNALIRDPITAYRTGRKTMNIGPGPVAKEQRYAYDPVDLDTQKLDTPKVPDPYVPVVDKARMEKVAAIVGQFDEYTRFINKQDAWLREQDKRRHGERSVYDRLDEATAGLADPLDSNSIYVRALKAASSRRRVRRPQHPMDTITLDADDWRGFRKHGEPEVKVYDPITGRVEKSGYVVPLRHTVHYGAPHKKDVDWYRQHRELLASTGHRIMVDKDGVIFVGRLFQNRQRRQAIEVAEFTNSGGFYNLSDGKHYPLQDWNDHTPTTEAAGRMFRSVPERKVVEGDAPYGGPKRLEGPKTLFHGTMSQLPENLLPRDMAPLATGRMLGEGFYSTTSHDVAEGFGHKIYTIRGSKDGKKYHIFDLDKVPSQAELDRLVRWVRQNYDESNPGIVSTLEYVVSTARRYGLDGYYGRNDTPSWMDYLTHLSYDVAAQRVLTRYFEEVHRAGVLSHMGGRLTGNSNRVYVWLHPENLEVKPLYARTGKYVPVVDWLSNPASREVPIPENRIIRTGVRNPMFRQLHQNRARIEALGKELGSYRQRVKNPEHIALRRREYELMDALGLEYSDNYRDDYVNLAVGQGWYVMVDPEKFGRTHAEATAQNTAFDAATRAGGELRSQEVGVEDIDPDLDLDMDLDDIHTQVLRAIFHRREPKGYVKTKDANGNDVFYPSAFEGHRGHLMRSMIGSQGAMEQLSEGHGAATSLLRRLAVGHKAYQPPKMTDEARTKGTPENKKAVEYFHQWSNLLNGQIAHSPVWSKMLNGWRDADIVEWLDTTPEGAKVRRELKGKYSNTELWVNEHRAKLNYYLPNKKLQRLLGKGRLQPSQLRREVYEEDYPSVFGPDVEFLSARETGIRELVSWAADHLWHSLGTLPIDTLSRHPFARSMYDLRMKSLINSTDAKWLDDKMIQRFEIEARKFTREQVRKTLWDLMDQTNFTDALRFVAPFWGAQQEALAKWGRIVADRPETVARAFALNNAVYQNLITVNEDGEPTSRLAIEQWERETGLKWRGDPARGRFHYAPTDRVIMRIPEVMRHTPFGRALETIGTVGIPIGSANTVLQGEMPVLPGPGPLLTVPADKLLRLTSETLGAEFDEAFLYRWLFPIGRPQSGGVGGIFEQVLPGWGKRVMQFSQGDEGISYSNLMAETAREMELENRRKGLPAPTPEEVRSQANWVYALRIFTGLVSPVQTQYRPKHQFFIDEARRFQKEEGLDWFDKFVDKYGVAMARYTAASSRSTVGVPPTTEGLQEFAEHQPLIAKYPQWGEAMISPDAYDAEFSGDAYYAEFNLNVGPGDDTPLRDSQSLRERFAAADARAGWYEFRKVDAILDVELQNRGLTSLQQTGAEDLALIKSNFIADLTQRNKAWREEYNNFNNDIYSRVDELQDWAFRSEFDQRPDIQGVRQYLILRDQVTAELDRYAAETGGSRSLQAEENGALRNWFYEQVGGIAQQNPAFAEFYGRYLSQDTLSQGSGGF